MSSKAKGTKMQAGKSAKMARLPVLHELSAAEAARRIAAGEITSEALVTACLDHIDIRDSKVQAWSFLNPAQVLAEARARDRELKKSGPRGALHGAPVAMKVEGPEEIALCHKGGETIEWQVVEC